MRSRLPIALASLGLVAAGLALTPAVATSRPPIATLAADNTFTFDGASGQRVLIRHRVTFSNLEKDNPDLQVTGGGAMAAFVLVRDGDVSGLDSTSTESLLAVRMPASAGGGLYIQAHAVPATKPNGTSCLPVVGILCDDTYPDLHLASLDPGYYRVVGVGRSATLTVHLVLHGLSGSLDLAPAMPVKGSIVPVAQRVPTLPATPTVAAGAFGSLTGRGLIFSLMSVDKGPDVAKSFGSCDYNGIYTALEPVAFLPHCPGGYNGVPPIEYVGADVTTDRWTLLNFETAGVGTYGRGFFFSQAGPVSFVDGYTVYLPFPR